MLPYVLLHPFYALFMKTGPFLVGILMIQSGLPRWKGRMGDFLASLSGISRMSQYLDTAIYLGNGNSLNMFCWNMDFGMFSMLHSSIKLVKYFISCGVGWTRTVMLESNEAKNILPKKHTHTPQHCHSMSQCDGKASCIRAWLHLIDQIINSSQNLTWSLKIICMK